MKSSLCFDLSFVRITCGKQKGVVVPGRMDVSGVIGTEFDFIADVPDFIVVKVLPPGVASATGVAHTC